MHLGWNRVLAIIAGIITVVLGLVIVLSSPPLADPTVGWGLVAAGAGLLALSVPIP